MKLVGIYFSIYLGMTIRSQYQLPISTATFFQKPIVEDKGWCAESWCYVDPCNCELDEPATKVGF